MSEAQAPDVWALIELMGRTRVAGRISEVQQFGAPAMQVEVPDVDGRLGGVHCYRAGAVFGWHLISEAEARAWAARLAVPGALPTFQPRSLTADAYVDGPAFDNPWGDKHPICECPVIDGAVEHEDDCELLEAPF